MVWAFKLMPFEAVDVTAAIEAAMAASPEWVPSLPSVLAILDPPPTDLDRVFLHAMAEQYRSEARWIRDRDAFLQHQWDLGRVLMLSWRSDHGEHRDRWEWVPTEKAIMEAERYYYPADLRQLREKLPAAVARLLEKNVFEFIHGTRQLQAGEPEPAEETNDGGVL